MQYQDYVDRHIVSQNYLSLIQIPEKSLSPQNYQEWLTNQIPALIKIITSTLPFAKSKVQQQAIKILFQDISKIIEISGIVSISGAKIPVVFEGFHLYDDEKSAISQLVSEFIDLVQEAGGIDLSDEYEVLVFKDLLVLLDSFNEYGGTDDPEKEFQLQRLKRPTSIAKVYA